MNFDFKKKGITHTPIKFWELNDGNYIIIYQGNRGGNPELDFIVKYKSPNKRLRAPSHTHWIVDLLIKVEYNKLQVLDYIKEWIEIYEKISPFQSKEERDRYRFIYNEYFCEKYFDLDNLGIFSVEFLSALIELFIKCEKQTQNAFMFKNLLILIKEYCEDKKDFYQVVSYSKRV